MNLKDYQEHLKRMKEDPEYKMNYIKKMKEQQKEDFLKIKPFVNAEDIPDLPKVDAKEWKEYFVPILIEKGAIPKVDLIDGEWYYGDHRRCNVAKWNEKDNQFDYLRYKFGYFWDNCNHFEDDDGYALFVPLRLATKEEALEEESKIEN